MLLVQRPSTETETARRVCANTTRETPSVTCARVLQACFTSGSASSFRWCTRSRAPRRSGCTTTGATSCSRRCSSTGRASSGSTPRSDPETTNPSMVGTLRVPGSSGYEGLVVLRIRWVRGGHKGPALVLGPVGTRVWWVRESGGYESLVGTRVRLGCGRIKGKEREQQARSLQTEGYLRGPKQTQSLRNRGPEGPEETGVGAWGVGETPARSDNCRLL